MAYDSPTTIAEYIAGCAPEVQPLLQKMYTTIAQAAPQASEKISWGMPTFVYHGNLVHFSAETKHMGFHPAPSAIVAFQDRLGEYSYSKGTIRFPYDTPIPFDLVRDIVIYRVKEQESQAAAKSTGEKSKPPSAPRIPLSEEIAEVLTRENLLETYYRRPPYQQNDYLRWIADAKRPPTKQRRLAQMLEELRAGDTYRGRPYGVKK